jgi:apolipoprotein D and lipocalin family protein
MRKMLFCALALMAGGCCCGGGVLGLGSLLGIGYVLQLPDVVPYVDLTRYVGKWYEIAHYPTAFQADCGSSTAEYTAQDDGTIKVFNTCLAADGSVVSTIEGTASVVDPKTNAKLAVRFPNVPIPAPYWIIDLGTDYEYAVVSDPFRLTLFILSRTPTLDSATLDGIKSRLVDQGYDPEQLIYDVPVSAP